MADPLLTGRVRWSHAETVETSADPNVVWRLWTDFRSRDGWDDIEWARLDGPLEVGTKGQWKPSFMPTQKVWIERVEPGAAFTVAATHAAALGVLHYHHELEPRRDGTTLVTHRLELTGRLAPVIGRFAGRKMAKELPEVLRRLVASAGATPEDG